MKNLILSTAIAMAAATTASAQQSAEPPLSSGSGQFLDMQQHADTMLFASDLIGAQLYAGAADADGSGVLTSEMESELESVGEVDDVILTSTGDVQALLLNVGGFLGIGEREVIVSMNQVQILRSEEDPTEIRFVLNATREEFEAAPAFDRSTFNVTGRPAENETTDPAAGTTENTTAIGGGADQEPQPKDTGRSGSDNANAGGQDQSERVATEAQDPQMLSRQMEGASVEDDSGKELGTVADTRMSAKGDRIETVIIELEEVAGADKSRVAAPFDRVRVQQGQAGAKTTVVLLAPVEGLPRAEDN